MQLFNNVQRKSHTVSNRQAFSLIEIVVVVAIISFLAAILIASLDDARKQARDARRMEDLHTIAKVFALDRFERGRVFDCNSGVKIEEGFEVVAISLNAPGCNESGYIEALVLDYFGFIPADQLGPGDPYYFYYYDFHGCGNGQPPGYLVYAAMEKEENSNREEVCAKGNTTLRGGNSDGYYNYNDITEEEVYPYVVRIGDPE